MCAYICITIALLQGQHIILFLGMEKVYVALWPRYGEVNMLFMFYSCNHYTESLIYGEVNMFLFSFIYSSSNIISISIIY